MQSRREALKMVCMAVASATLPSIPNLSTAEKLKSKALAWVVGTPGESDGQIIRALTSDEALKIAVQEYSGANQCFCAEAKADWGEDQCDYCRAINNYDVWRAEPMDNIANPIPADWIEAGFSHLCQRCDYECDENNAFVVNREVVCEDCMRIEDWEVINPKRALEIKDPNYALDKPTAKRLIRQ